MKPKQQMLIEIGQKVRQGLADVDRGAIVSLEDAERRLKRQPVIHDRPRSH